MIENYEYINLSIIEDSKENVEKKIMLILGARIEKCWKIHRDKVDVHKIYNVRPEFGGTHFHHLVIWSY